MKVRACPFLTTYMLVFLVNTLLLGHGRIVTPGVCLSFDSKRFFPFLRQRVLELLERVIQFWLFFFVFLFYLCIYLVVLGVRYCAGASLVTVSRGYSSLWSTRPGRMGFGSCGTRT